MSPLSPREPHWADAAQLQGLLPPALAPWLLDQGSLTARLIEHSGGAFAVTRLRQGWGRAQPGERLALGCPPRTRVLVREVLLLGRGQPWVFARSLVPCTSLTGRLRALRTLDDRPLGALLFKAPDLERGPLALARIGARHQYVSAPDDAFARGEPLWGRRSVFYLDRQPLLVSEVFLPAFLDSLNRLDSRRPLDNQQSLDSQKPLDNQTPTEPHHGRLQPAP